MKMKTIVCIAFFVFQVTKAQNKVTYTCTPTLNTGGANTHGTLKIEAEYIAEALGGVYALDKFDSCSTDAAATTQITAPAQTGGAGNYKQTITWDFNAAGSTVAADCGFDTTTKAGTSSFTLIYQPLVKVITATARKYLISCDWTGGTATVEAEEVTASGVVDGKAKQDVGGTLEFWVDDKQSATMKVTDTTVQLVFHIPDKTATVVNAKVTDCVSSGASDYPPANTISMYKDDGCGSGNSPWLVTAGWTMVDDGNVRYIKAAKHGGWSHRGSSGKVYIKCTVLPCTATMNTAKLCELTTGCSKKRRRRDFQNHRNLAMTTVETVIRVVDNRSTQKEQGGDITASQCLNNVTWVSVVGVLGFLLIFTLFVAVFFGSKALRNRTEVHHEYPNPGFKA